MALPPLSALTRKPIDLPEEEDCRYFCWDRYLKDATTEIESGRPFKEKVVALGGEDGKVGESIVNIACLENKKNSPLKVWIDRSFCQNVSEATLDRLGSVLAPRCHKLSIIDIQIPIIDTQRKGLLPFTDAWFRPFISPCRITQLTLNFLNKTELSSKTLCGFAHGGLTLLHLEGVEAADDPQVLDVFARNSPRLSALELWYVSAKTLAICLPHFASPFLTRLTIRGVKNESKDLEASLKSLVVRSHALATIELQDTPGLSPSISDFLQDRTQCPALQELEINSCSPAPEVKLNRSDEAAAPPAKRARVEEHVEGSGGGGSA